MNQHTLKITAHDRPTVLERLLQVSRYRGFVVTGITALPNAATHMLDINLMVSGVQTIEYLTKQLDKLIDINDISVENSLMQQCRA